MNKEVVVKRIFHIEITETLSRVIKVNAKNAQSALLNVQERYKNEDIILDSADYRNTEFEVLE